MKRRFGVQPTFGLVERDRDSGAVVMWIAPDPKDHNWITITIDAGEEPQWWDNRGVSYGTRWNYIGWDPVEEI